MPFAKANNLIIKQTLGRIRAQGTTPIARHRTGRDDFPDAPGRNVIILITDGIEACDEDPCAVSRTLQAGHVVKPFVIGMGIEEDMAKDFGALATSTMRPTLWRLNALRLVLEQAMHNTTLH